VSSKIILVLHGYNFAKTSANMRKLSFTSLRATSPKAGSEAISKKRLLRHFVPRN